jgi:hypothetical protein
MYKECMVDKTVRLSLKMFPSTQDIMEIPETSRERDKTMPSLL